MLHAPCARSLDSALGALGLEVASSFAAAGNDPCWIHQACSSTPGYSDTGSMGRGWYCTDGVYVDGSTSYDPCSIHEACHVGVKFEGDLLEVQSPWNSESANLAPEKPSHHRWLL